MAQRKPTTETSIGMRLPRGRAGGIRPQRGNRAVLALGLALIMLLAMLLALAAQAGELRAQSLWVDHNPYNPNANLREGVILKLQVDEPLEMEYEYENTIDDEVVVKLQPDRNLTDFLPPVDTTKNTTTKKNNVIRADVRLQFRMAVTVSADPENNTVVFSGTKLLAYEGGRSRQQMQISGRVHIDDVSSGRTVRSQDVADLQLVIIGAPIRQDRELPMKQTEDEDGQPIPSAELSDEERERLLLEYLNRVLGASDDRP